jgi:phosphoribosyl-ATP pyrophosphohydrolase
MTNFLNTLFQVIQERKANPTPDSYTAKLFAEGEDRILQKVGEEAVEIIIAGKGQGNERLISESADFLYHWLVLLAEKGVDLGEVEAELERRHK